MTTASQPPRSFALALPAQWGPLPGSRILLRTPRGLGILPNLEEPQLAALVAAFDEPRKVSEGIEALAGVLSAERAGRLLEALAGDLFALAGERDGLGAGVQRGPAANLPPLSPVDRPTAAVLVSGAGGRRLAWALREGFGLPVIACEAPEWAQAQAQAPSMPWVVALEDAPYDTLLGLQRDAVAAGRPLLFVTTDADGLRLGPLSVPGSGPCLACAQIDHAAALGLPAEDLLQAVGRFRTLPLPSRRPFEELASRLASSLGDIAARAPRGRRALRTAWRSPTGAWRELPVERSASCPLCGSTSSSESSPTASLARAVEIERLAWEERRPLRALKVLKESVTEGAATPCTRIGIVGGGTAGYLTALALRRHHPELEVTLIESSAVPVIGVGEATTPLMPQFLHNDLGIDLDDLLQAVRPTFKMGIRFDWGGAGRGRFDYPFGPLHLLEALTYDGNLATASAQAARMRADTLPLEIDSAGGGMRWQGEVAAHLAYHLDNRRFVAFLAEEAHRRGLERVDARIARVETDPASSRVEALQADDGRRFEFDLYVDCSGFRSLLLEEALGSTFVSFADSLPTDSALVATVPQDGTIRPYTTAEAMDAGWCWSTPQEEADHRGYVYASAFLSPEDAEAEMRRKNPGMGEARLLRFRAGRHQHFWRGNVVALGNAYGFVEPLESTALHMLIRQIGLLLAALPLRRDEQAVGDVLNARVNAWWDHLRFFLALHFRFNRALETPFWRHCRDAVVLGPGERWLRFFAERGPLSYDRLVADAFDAPDPLWGPEGIDTLLLGQGVKTQPPRPLRRPDAWAATARLYRETAARGLPQAAALKRLRSDGGARRELARQWALLGRAFPLPVRR